MVGKVQIRIWIRQNDADSLDSDPQHCFKVIPSLLLSSAFIPNFDMSTLELRKIIIRLFLKLAISNITKKVSFYIFISEKNLKMGFYY